MSDARRRNDAKHLPADRFSPTFLLSGCFGEDLYNGGDKKTDMIYLEPWERKNEIYDDSDVFSQSQKMALMMLAQYNRSLSQFRA